MVRRRGRAQSQQEAAPPENVPRDGAMGGEPSSDICTAPVTGWAQQQSLGDTELRVSERVG